MRLKNTAILIFWVVSSAFAQKTPEVEKNIGYFRTGLSYQMWKVEPNVQTINQIALPLYFVYPISPTVSFNISQTPAMSWWREDEQILSTSDTWAQANFMVTENAMINLGVTLPTGKTRLDTSQYTLTQAMLSRPIYQYRLPQYGQGFAAKTGISYAIPLADNILLGTGLQYIYRSTYYPLEFTYDYYGTDGLMHSATLHESYKPGDQASVLAGVDVLIHRDLSVSFDAMYSYFFKDYLDEIEVFNSGQLFMAVANMHYQFSYAKYLDVTLLFRSKSRNELLQQQYLQNPEINYNGAQFELTADYKFYESGENGLLFLLDSRYYRSKYITEPVSDFLVGAGIGVIYNFGSNYTVDFNAKYMFGALAGGERDALGIITNIGLSRTY